MGDLQLTSGHYLGEETTDGILLRLIESLEDNRLAAVISQNASIKLDVANRIYCLKCLGIFHVADSALTDEHLKEARRFVWETKKFAEPAERCLLRTHLNMAVEKVEKRISEVELLLIQRETEEAVKITLIS